MSLQEVELEIDESKVPAVVRRWAEFASKAIQAYWDRYPARMNPEWQECDFEYAAAALIACQSLITRRRLVEWGAGFGGVAGCAQLLGFEVTAIEVEEFLHAEAQRLVASFDMPETGELGGEQPAPAIEHWLGDFLPLNAGEYAEASEPIVSLRHVDPDARSDIYRQNRVKLEYFDVVFAYAWPGEEHFLKRVFAAYCPAETVLVLYRGPFHVEVYRRTVGS